MMLSSRSTSESPRRSEEYFCPPAAGRISRKSYHTNHSHQKPCARPSRVPHGSLQQLSHFIPHVEIKTQEAESTPDRAAKSAAEVEKLIYVRIVIRP